MPWEPLPGERDDEPTRVGQPLDRVMRNLGGPRASTVRSVFDQWPQLVGDQLAAHARPVSLRDGVLVIGVDDPAWATQLRYLEVTLINQIAAAFGTAEVTAIEIRVRPRPPEDRSPRRG